MVHRLVRCQTGPMMTEFVWLPRIICSNGWSEQKSETIGFGQENYHILSCLSLFSFQMSISVKISDGLLRNLCENLEEKFVSD